MTPSLRATDHDGEEPTTTRETLGLVITTTRTPTGRGRPDPHAPAAGATFRLHRSDCRHAQGPSAQWTTFSVWNTLMEHARTTDTYLLCKACRPEEAGR